MDDLELALLADWLSSLPSVQVQRIVAAINKIEEVSISPGVTWDQIDLIYADLTNGRHS